MSENKKSDKRMLAVAFGYGVELVVVIVVGLYVGRWLGGQLGAQQGGTIIGCFVGFAGWTWRMVRLQQLALKNDSRSK
ncbi:MAG: AtpZ/AtpI family protein [Bdellovibrionaceae bacterium]|nr:AtpZ/AtpI family protein [Pseudobdellovibrionaceae bacterium]